MEDTRDSAALTHFVKIVKMVVKFHPLLTVTNLIFGVIFLHDWIKKEVSNEWKALNVYCQSTMKALLDPIIEKMKNLSKVLQMHLDHEAAKDLSKAKLIGTQWWTVVIYCTISDVISWTIQQCTTRH
ncbi:hypothetical protein SLA2020_485550 [Shorea laevis]